MSAQVEEVTASAHSLSDMAEMLHKTVDRFKLKLDKLTFFLIGILLFHKQDAFFCFGFPAVAVPMYWLPSTMMNVEQLGVLQYSKLLKFFKVSRKFPYYPSVGCIPTCQIEITDRRNDYICFRRFFGFSYIP
jgi:hypothetical protein